MQLPLPKKRSLLFVAGFLFLTGIFLLFAFGYYLMSPAEKDGQDQLFLVRDGSTLREVAGELNRKGIIAGKSLFLLWARLMGHSTDIKAGEYMLNPGMPPIKILSILSKGAVIMHPVTIPEGYTKEQIGDLLEKRGLVGRKEFLALTGDPKSARRYGISGKGLEGYLYPDTYQFVRGLPTMSVIDTMVRRFLEIAKPFRERMEQLDMAMEEVVILASIVEKETGLAEERPLIASVFLNRLKKNMRLESDPTVIYGLEKFDGNLTREHLSRKTPYNTYVIRGLPPGPISNPGKEAIRAVLYPAESSYLYFVSKNDGSHYFSETLSEHNRAVDFYQRKRHVTS